ncbi:protocadherin-23 [Limosa lapponica baueri]|uniref:Protocadherin-23 n=1 Tax=Limosa lapponica baueri TaxID=1758121 RepID=A0A2I0UN18_LIMLA|nr:protocadherin-23 [Limosa lapponica baueri]
MKKVEEHLQGSIYFSLTDSQNCEIKFGKGPVGMARDCGAAPVYNLSLAVDEGLPAETLPETGIIRTARRLDRERRARYSFAAATLRGEVVQLNGYALLEEGGAAGELPLFQLRYGRPEPLELVLLRRLDRERAETHQLVVEARAEYRARLREDAPLGTSDPDGYFAVEERSGPEVSSALVSVAVLDGGEAAAEDGGGGIALALLGGEGAFALRPAGAGVFFLCVAGPLDRESRDLYELRLVATDGGAPPLSAEEPLLLRVADLNDEAPAFPQPHYRAAVSEAASPGTAVLRLSAWDADEPGSPNAEVPLKVDSLSHKTGSTEGRIFTDLACDALEDLRWSS